MLFADLAVGQNYALTKVMVKHILIGSLLLVKGKCPRYAQLYMYDGQVNLNRRLKFLANDNNIDPKVVQSLKEMLDRENSSV